MKSKLELVLTWIVLDWRKNWQTNGFLKRFLLGAPKTMKGAIIKRYDAILERTPEVYEIDYSGAHSGKWLVTAAGIEPVERVPDEPSEISEKFMEYALYQFAFVPKTELALVDWAVSGRVGEGVTLGIMDGKYAREKTRYIS